MKPLETTFGSYKKQEVKRGEKTLKYAFGFAIFTFIVLIVAFATPYWFQSWPRIHSKFLRIGLWEVCFAGFIHPADVERKAYFGCWWIYSKEYELIRYWIFPGWFIAVELFAMLAVLACVATLAFHVLAYMNRDNDTEHANYVKWGLLFTTLTGAFQTTVVLVFGVSSRVDWNWMPMQFFNYLSWSYGLAVVAAAFAFFTAVADYIYIMKLKPNAAHSNFEKCSSNTGYYVQRI